MMQSLAPDVLRPLQFLINPGERVYWLYLFTTLLIALLVFVFRSPPGKTGLVEFLFPKSMWKHESTLADHLYFLINAMLYRALVIPFALSIATASSLFEGLFQASPLALHLVPAGWPSIALLTLIVFITADFGYFFGHWLLHKIPLLWEFHKTHHSAETLTPITVYRMHPVDDIVVGSSVSFCYGAGWGIATALVAPGTTSATVWGLNAGLFLFYLLGYNLRHTHIWVSYGPAVERFLQSPAQHQIHHSADQRHYDKNMGFALSIWDGLFGTLYTTKTKPEALRFGLIGDEAKAYSGVIRLYVLPFIKAARLLRSRLLEKTA
jgi:sterol desaturase/sphingolipid hydroxylase (fatty acid hydroxylase superfamily)